jgi:predicted amidohydrolase
MKEDLKVALVQADILWEDIPGNLSRFKDKIEKIDGADIILLPELFSTGFSMTAKRLAESMDGPTLAWMREISRDSGAAIAGSLVIKENGKIFNRLVWVEPEGRVMHYDKRHLFTLAGEEAHFDPGSERLVLDYKGWKICPLICYDLRFPVWARNTIQDGAIDYDILIYVASWPEVRSYAWEQLLIARAIENQAYCIGVNRIGKDPSGHTYKGMSVLVDAMGEVVAGSQEYKEQTILANLSAPNLNAVRRKISFLPDQDPFRLSPA